MKQIKKLTWTKNVMDDPIAIIPFGYYYIDQSQEIYEAIWITGKGKTESVGNGTLEQVKELCQNHFESLVNQCLN